MLNLFIFLYILCIKTFRINAALNPAALNNAAQALNSAALNPSSLLSGQKKDQINFYVPKMPKQTAAAPTTDDLRFLNLEKYKT